MLEFITLPFFQNKALEDELKVHDSLKEAKAYAKQYLKSHKPENGYRVEISAF